MAGLEIWQDYVEKIREAVDFPILVEQTMQQFSIWQLGHPST